jgi:hypothetical protein
MAIDNELEKSSVAAEIHEQSHRPIQNMMAQSGLAGTISK